MEPLFLVNGIFPAFYAGDPDFCLDNLPNFAYVIDSKGWKLFKRNAVTEALVEVSVVDGIASHPGEVKFRGEKIDFETFEKVQNYFKAIFTKHGSEVNVLLYYSEENGDWQVRVPAQSVKYLAVKYGEAPQIEGYVLAGTIHSHSDAPAFHSGTDDYDEEFFDGVHITIGCVHSVPDYSCSIVVNGVREIVALSSVVDGIEAQRSFPSEWMDMIKLEKPRIHHNTLETDLEPLYKKYFNSEISEEEYLAELKTLQKKEDKIREEERKKEKKNNHSCKIIANGSDY
jgi:hypothetical protein